MPRLLCALVLLLVAVSLAPDALAGAPRPGLAWPGESWPTATPAERGMDEAALVAARSFALTGGGAGAVVRDGYLVMTWGDPAQRFDLKSTTKSIGAAALGVAIGDGLVGLDDLAIAHHPTLGTPPASNAATGWLGQITVQQLATHTAGFDTPGGYTALLFEPGTRWLYSDGGANWLAEILTLAYGRDLRDVMFERVFTPLGISDADLTWRSNAYRPASLDGIVRRELGSGISANVDALARIGLLFLRGGVWQSGRILPATFVDRVRTPEPGVVPLPEVDPASHGDASLHYGLLWWNNADGAIASVPRDAYWSWGLFESLIVVIPSLGIVAARAGGAWQPGWQPDYSVIAPFLEAIAASVPPAPLHACFDGLDNDGDGLVDAGPDPGCATLVSEHENPACDDFVDNDGDGLVDWGRPGFGPADPACLGNASGDAE